MNMCQLPLLCGSVRRVQIEGYVWQQPHASADTGSVDISVSQVNEPPRVFNAYFYMAENTYIERYPPGKLVHTVQFIGPRPRSGYSYTLVAGNRFGAFAVNSSNGEVRVGNSSALDFETTPKFNLTIVVSDGKLRNPLTSVRSP